MTDAEFATLRETLGVPAQWVADQLDVSLRSVQFWETGRTAVPLKAAILLLQLDATIDQAVKTLVAQAQRRKTVQNMVLLLRYKDDADMAKAYPKLAGYPLRVQGVMLARASRTLSEMGLQVSIHFQAPLAP